MASRRVKIFVWAAGIVATVVIIVTVSIVFVIFRSIVSTPADSTTAAAALEAIRRNYPGREPLITITDLKRGAVRVNRAATAPRKKVDTLHFIFWNPEDGKLARGEAPAWVIRMRVSPLGIGDWSFSDLNVTLEDIERYAPGIILDFKTPEREHVLVWVQ